MFAKLLKNEFRSVKRGLWPLTLAAILASAIGYIIILIGTTSLQINDFTLFQIISVLFPAGIVLLLVIYMIGSNIYLYIHFYKTKYTDEGYLTFTLPATTHQILLSSILNIIIWSAIITFTTFLGVLFMFSPLLLYLDSSFNFFKNLFQIFEYIEITPAIIIYMILQAISSFCYSLILPIFSITVGSIVSSKHKLLVSFAVGYGISMIYNIIINIITITETIATDSFNSIMHIKASMFIVSIATIIISVIGYFVMHKLIKNKLNL